MFLIQSVKPTVNESYKPVLNMNRKVAIAVLFLFAATVSADPPCHISELWKCHDIPISFLHTLPKKSIPETKSEVEVMCQEWKKAYDCFGAYGKKCMSPLQREAASLIFEGGVDVYDELCTPGSATQNKYLKNAPCLNEVAKTDEFRSLLDYVFAVFHKLHHVPAIDMLSYSCCGVKKSCNSLLGMVRQHCDEEGAELIQELKIMTVGLITEAMCEDLDGTEPKCKELLPPDDAKLASYGDSPFLLFLHDILNNFMVD